MVRNDSEPTAAAAGVAARVRELMHERGLSQRGLSRSGGLSLGVVNDLVNARYGAGTAIGTFEKVAAALGVSVGELFGVAAAPLPAREPERAAETLELLRRLDDGDSTGFADLRARLDDLADVLRDALDVRRGDAPPLALDDPATHHAPVRGTGALADRFDPPAPSEPDYPDGPLAPGERLLRPRLELLGGSDTLLVPLYGHAAAGLGAYNEPVTAQADVERIPVPRLLRPQDGVLIATRVRGDSMEPELSAGDIVVVHYPELQPALRLLSRGALVAVTLADGGEWLDYVKRVVEPRSAAPDGGEVCALAGPNPAVPPLAVRPRELRFVGAVRMILRG